MLMELTERDVYDGGVRSKSERWRLRDAGFRDAVQEQGIIVVVE